jgi:hypothetical protein
MAMETGTGVPWWRLLVPAYDSLALETLAEEQASRPGNGSAPPSAMALRKLAAIAKRMNEAATDPQSFLLLGPPRRCAAYGTGRVPMVPWVRGPLIRTRGCTLRSGKTTLLFQYALALALQGERVR